MTTISENEKRIKALEKKLVILKRKDICFAAEINNNKKKKYLKSLISAGKIFEELNILDNYDKEAVVALLQNNINQIIKK